MFSFIKSQHLVLQSKIPQILILDFSHSCHFRSANEGSCEVSQEILQVLNKNIGHDW